MLAGYYVRGLGRCRHPALDRRLPGWPAARWQPHADGSPTLVSFIKALESYAPMRDVGPPAPLTSNLALLSAIYMGDVYDTSWC